MVKKVNRANGGTVAQDVLDQVTVAGARAYWKAIDLEAILQDLSVAMLAVTSDPHLTWEEARMRLSAALNESFARRDRLEPAPTEGTEP